MRSRRPLRVLKEEFADRAKHVLREIIETARRVCGDAADKREFVHRSVNDGKLVVQLAAHGKQGPSEQIERLRSFLQFAQTEGLADLAWASVETRLFASRSCSERTIRLVSHLLCETVDVETMTSATPSQATTAHQQAPTGSLLVDWHGTIDDHRQVILGQLPHADLFPAVFVFSADRKQWYPQHDLVRLKKPGGLAFVCNARFGNPHGIGHVPEPGEETFPWYGKVRVYALRSKPQDDRIPAVLTDDELDRWSKEHGAAGNAETSVTRDWPLIASIVVEGNRERDAWTYRPPECVTCSFPLDLSWQTRGTVFYEIRKAPTDEVVHEGDVRGELKMRIVDKSSALPVSTSIRKVALPGAGIYRLRYWGLRKSFLDQELELWLEIKPRPAIASRKQARDGASRRLPVSLRR